jgi:hypothetical protein
VGKAKRVARELLDAGDGRRGSLQETAGGEARLCSIGRPWFSNSSHRARLGGMALQFQSALAQFESTRVERLQ